MATIINPYGLLAYGDNDGTVTFRSSMTSLASLTTPEIGSSSFIQQGTLIFDPIKGMSCTTGGGYTDNLSGFAKTSYNMELSFEVETKVIACTNAVSPGSSGGVAQTNPTGIEYFISIGNGGVANNIVTVKLVNKTLQLSIAGVVTVAAAPFNDADSVGNFTTFTLTSNGNIVSLYVNGILHSTAVRPFNVVDPYYAIWFGQNPNEQLTNNLTTGYIRNLQIAARPRLLSVIGPLSSVICFGDSYASSSFDAYAVDSYNLAKSFIIKQELQKLGLRLGSFSDQAFGGRKIIGSGNASLYLLDNVPTALLATPTLVIFQAGRNDVGVLGTLSSASVTSSMRSIVERFMGVNGNPTTTVRKMVICTLPLAPVDNAIVDVNTVNAAFAALPSWFDTTYPSKAGSIILQDTFADFGGSKIRPEEWGPSDLIHPNIGKGWPRMGRSWFSGILKALR